MDNWTVEIQICQLQVTLHPELFIFIQTNFKIDGQFSLFHKHKKIAKCIHGLLRMKAANTRFMRELLHREVANDSRAVAMDSRAYYAIAKSFKK